MLELSHVNKSYSIGGEKLTILSDLSLTIEPGERVAIVGPSGSGKSTLLHIMSTMDTCDSGTVSFQGRDLTKCSQKEKSDCRLRYFGFIFQSYYLVETLSLYDNIILPAVAAGKKGVQSQVEALAEQLGLSRRLNHFPHQLSGGEQQRAAIARALINQPHIIFADEPTGNLDFENSQTVMELLKQFSGGERALVFVTHDRSLEKYADRVIDLGKGRDENG